MVFTLFDEIIKGSFCFSITQFSCTFEKLFAKFLETVTAISLQSLRLFISLIFEVKLARLHALCGIIAKHLGYGCEVGPRHIGAPADWIKLVFLLLRNILQNLIKQGAKKI